MDESSGNYTLDHDEGFVAIANELLSKFHLSAIENLSQCTAPVIVALYEGILGDKLLGIIANPITREDDITNIQILIDHLQHDVLRADLSHITGEAVVNGNLLSIRYLIEILAGLLECVMEQIDSEESTDLEGDSVEDGDLQTSGSISSISHVLPDDYSSQSSPTRPRKRRIPATVSRPPDDDGDDDRSTTSTNELIRLGESAATAYGLDGSVQVLEPDGRSSLSSTHSQRPQEQRTHPQRADQWQHGIAIQAGADSTQDLIREGESLVRRYGVQDEPTKDTDMPTLTEVSTQDASISTASSASWPKQPPVPSTKPPNEFDTLGLGLRSRSYGDKEYTMDSLVRGLGKDSEEVAVSHHAHRAVSHHAHTHHHYHQPVTIQSGTDPVYASSLPLPATSKDPRRRHQTEPLPVKSNTISRPASSIGSQRHQTEPLPRKSNTTSRPASSLGSHTYIPSVASGSQPYESNANQVPVSIHDEKESRTSRDIPDTVSSSIQDGKASLAAKDVHADIPASIRDGKGTYDYRTGRERLPMSIPRDRGSHASKAVHEDIPASIRDGKGTYDYRTSHDRLPMSIRSDRGSHVARDMPDDIPASIRDGKGNYEYRTGHDKLPMSIRSERESHAARAVHDDIPRSIRDGKGTYASRVTHDQEPKTSRHKTAESDVQKDSAPRHVSGHGGPGSAKVTKSALRDSRQPIGQIPSTAQRLSRTSNNNKEVGIDSQHVNSRVSSYQADKLSSSGAEQPALSREERVSGFVSSSTSERPFSLASERYKSYLSSRLQESGLTSKTKTGPTETRPTGTHPTGTRPAVTRPLPLAAADRHSKSFPPYETIDKYVPSGPDSHLKTLPERNSRVPGSQDLSRARQSHLKTLPERSSREPASQDLSRARQSHLKTLPERSSREPASQDSSRVRQSNLSVESSMVHPDRRDPRFDDADGTRRPGERVSFDETDESIPVSRDYERPTISKEFVSLDSDTDLDTHSDTEVDYSPVPDRRVVVLREDYNLRTKGKRSRSKRPVAKQRSVLLPPTSQPNLKVRFEDALDKDAKGEIGKIRKKLNKERKTQDRQKQVLHTVYASNLKEVKQSLKQQTARRKQQIEQEDREYKEVVGKPSTSKYQPGKKYSAKVAASRQGRPVGRKVSGKRKRSASSSPVRRHRKPLHIADDEMLPTVMQEFPFLHVSPHAAHNMWNKQMRQMEQLTKAGLDVPRRNKTQMKMEEAEKRQEILLNIMKKELSHNQRMRDNKERRAAELAMSSKAKEQKQVTARARRYYDEFRLRAKSRMLKRRNREEQVFKKLFDDGLAIQKARIKDMRAYAKEKREQVSSRQQDEIDSLENYYRDQFSMLAETIAKERHQLQVRDNAQNKVMEQMKREMRRKMEREVRDFQEQLYRDEDTEYFREVEADRMRKQLQMANYKTQL